MREAITALHTYVWVYSTWTWSGWWRVAATGGVAALVGLGCDSDPEPGTVCCVTASGGQVTTATAYEELGGQSMATNAPSCDAPDTRGAGDADDTADGDEGPDLDVLEPSDAAVEVLEPLPDGQDVVQDVAGPNDVDVEGDGGADAGPPAPEGCCLLPYEAKAVVTDMECAVLGGDWTDELADCFGDAPSDVCCLDPDAGFAFPTSWAECGSLGWFGVADTLCELPEELACCASDDADDTVPEAATGAQCVAAGGALAAPGLCAEAGVEACCGLPQGTHWLHAQLC